MPRRGLNLKSHALDHAAIEIGLSEGLPYENIKTNLFRPYVQDIFPLLSSEI
jgi:hypothetical protein